MKHPTLPPLLLAPMAGYTDYAMRRICRSLGATHTTTEMVSAKACVYGDEKTWRLAYIEGHDAPASVQIFGSEPDTMARAAERLSAPPRGVAPVAIDINMGCPVPKIFSNGEGSALMRDPALIERIVRAVVRATPLPVTVKLRRGIDEAHRNAVECALAAEAGGAAAVTVHGRTRVQMYSGRSDAECIKDVKRALQIPVIANGDITSAATALALLDATGADGLMIGRGAVGNPFIFREILAALRGEPYTPPTREERVETALAQLSYAIADKGEGLAVRESRGQLSAYLYGFRAAAQLRARLHTAVCRADVEAVFALALTAAPDA